MYLFFLVCCVRVCVCMHVRFVRETTKLSMQRMRTLCYFLCLRFDRTVQNDFGAYGRLMMCDEIVDGAPKKHEESILFYILFSLRSLCKIRFIIILRWRYNNMVMLWVCERLCVCVHTVHAMCGYCMVVYVLNALNTSKLIRNQMTTVKTPKTFVCRIECMRVNLFALRSQSPIRATLTLLDLVVCAHGHACLYCSH